MPKGIPNKSSGFWACMKQLKEGKKACGNTRIKDDVLKAKFVFAYNRFIERRPQGDSMIALQEVLADLQQQEQELAELNMSRLIQKEAYEKERKSIKGRIAKTKAKINELQINRVPESEHVPITEFDEEKAKRFLSKVIVRDFTVTFVFYNGAKICCRYNNGQPGHRKGWMEERMEA